MSLQKPSLHIFVFLIPLILYPSYAISIPSVLGEGRVLISMISLMDGNDILDNWTASGDTTYCSWIGVQCDQVGSVVALHLSNISLSGPFPNQVTNLRGLRLLNFSHNHLYGSLPSNIPKLKNLEVLDISYNYLSGVLPLDLCYLLKLRHLDLGTNLFWGSIPGECGRLKNVEYLSLSGNVLSGRIPAELGNLGNLKMLYLGGYYTSGGVIPPEIGNLNKLVYLDIQGCGLSGSIPSELGCLKNLETMSLQGNGLTGEIPSQLGGLKKLKTMSLQSNGLTGKIPSQLGGLKNLETISLESNGLTGEIPSELGGLKKLKTMSLQFNGLTGEIPSELGGLKNLETMSLQGNGITGKIPSEFVGLKNLETLSLSHNGLTGEIPVELSQLNELRELNLSNNKLTGLLPQRLGVSGKLLKVDVSNNRLTGYIHPNLCRGERLQILNVSYNSFVGPIPDFLASCNSLVKVHMRQNYLNGLIPAGLLYLPELSSIELDNNYLTGSIPEKINNVFSMLITMRISNNRLSGSLPSSIGQLSNLEFLDVHGNQLTGTIPLEISNCSALISIGLSGNRFSGMFPREFTNCYDHLVNIDLSHNNFRGPIPVEISNMSLSSLNVSGNHFNESIPEGLQYMESLSYPDFSYNNFSGIIIKCSLFWCLDPKYFAGNPYLSRPHFGDCTSQCHFNGSRTSQRHFKRDLLLALGPLLFFSLLPAVGAATVIKARALKKVGDAIGRSWEMTTFQILDFGRDDIVACIKEENVIGRGGAGVVYRGMMPDGQQIAVKKLTGIGIGSSNDHGFSAEIQTLGKIRHKHIVKLLAICSNVGTNLLVYEYVPNGSLGEVLHGNNGVHLYWDTRYKIAVEVAKGLCYLHHDCCPVILHRDVKSNNILLNSNFEAYIADFGLAKLLDHSDTWESMSSVAGSFGYIAPEYRYTLKVDEKSDVYSFGVVLLELITGKKPVEDSEFEEGMKIVGWAKKMTNLKKEEVMNIIDPQLNSFPMEDAVHMFFVALLCLQEQPVYRPPMRKIVYMLTHCKPRQAIFE